jgi:hypothetical protein
MSVPIVHALCEAEAIYVTLAKSDKIFVAGTEGVDVLMFATRVLYRRVTIARSPSSRSSQTTR